jgi:acetolactate synthase-1/2/3 large subunit
MTGAEALVKAAGESGVTLCFANTGTTEIPIVAALDSVGGIRAVPCVFEGVCTGAADGYGRMTGRPAMALLHLGPGLANGTANLHNARRARTPLVNVIGEHASWHRPNDPPLAMDIERLASTVSGRVRTSLAAGSLADDMSDTIAAALRGCVSTLIVPNDLQKMEVSYSGRGRAEAVFDPVSPETILRAARLLSGGKKTAMVLGGRALRRHGLLAAARVVAATGCALFCVTFPGFVERGGGLPAVARIPYLPELGLELLSPYDTVVLAGSGEPVTFFGYPGAPGKLIPPDRKRASIWQDGQDEIACLEALADELGAPAKVRAQETTTSLPPGLPTGALTPEKVCLVLAALQPENAIIVDEGLTTAFTYYAVSAGAPPHALMAVSGGAIGQGMPCALGAALASPERKVIDFQADGSALYTVQALWSQAREGADVTTLVCSNRSYRIVEMELERTGIDTGRTAAKALTRLSPPEIDWVRLAAGFGVPGVRVESAEDLAVAIRRALAEPGPHLIEMPL